MVISSARILIALVVLSLIFVNHYSIAARLSPRNIDGRGKISGPTGVDDNDQYCDSWKYTIEANDAGKWSTVPKRCVKFVKQYLEGKRYRSDSEAVTDFAVTFANSVKRSGARRKQDAWVFDIDETLLSNLAYYRDHGYGSEAYDEMKFNEWVKLGAAPNLTASLRLFNELKKLNFTIFLLTGRDESQRSITEKNLYRVGYNGWKSLILRGPSDRGEKSGCVQIREEEGDKICRLHDSRQQRRSVERLDRLFGGD